MTANWIRGPSVTDSFTAWHQREQRRRRLTHLAAIAIGIAIGRTLRGGTT